MFDCWTEEGPPLNKASSVMIGRNGRGGKKGAERRHVT
jgi:hypothetical protein